MVRELPPGLKLLVGSVCTIIYEFFIGHIFEILKIQKQINPHLSYSDIFFILTSDSTKGIFGIWDGYFPWGFLMAMCKGAAFSYGLAMFERLFTYLLNSDSNRRSKQNISIIASGFGGAFQGLIMSPLLLLKTRVITHERFRSMKGGAMATMIASANIGSLIISQHGFLALFKGMHIFAVKRFCDWITRYFFVDLLLKIFVDDDDGKHGKVKWYTITFWTLIGGSISALCTSFMDVMVALIQDEKRANDNSIGFLSLIADMYGNSEIIQRGLFLRLLHVTTTTVLMKNFVPWVCNNLARVLYEGDSKSEARKKAR